VRTAVLLAAAVCCSGAFLLGQSQNSSDKSDPQEVIIDEIVAKVNTEIITLTDLNVELDRLKRSIDGQESNPEARAERFAKEKRGLLSAIIRNKMIIQRAEDLGVLPNIDVDVNAAIQNILQENGIPDLETFRRILAQQNTSYEEYRRAIREQIIVQTMYQQFVYSRITILTPEIEQHYQENIKDYTDPAEVELAEILFLTEGKNAQTVRSKAEDVLARLEGGEAYEDLARQYSEGRTASRGGTIGKFKSGTMATVIEQAANSLQPGQHSGVLETDFGLLIIKVLSKDGARPKPLDEVRNAILQKLRFGKAEPLIKAFLDDLRQQSYVWVNPKYQKEYDVQDLL